MERCDRDTITGMVVLATLAEGSDPDLTEGARDLFRAYAAFLREIQACHAFDFTAFEAEILSLPRSYTSVKGELILALADPGTPVGSIAFRAAPPTAEPGACEIKRLFVRPEHRGQGIAERLVMAALDAARVRGYRWAILDTEPSTMQAAEALYRKLGFTAYTPLHPHNPVDVVYLRRSLR